MDDKIETVIDSCNQWICDIDIYNNSPIPFRQFYIDVLCIIDEKLSNQRKECEYYLHIKGNLSMDIFFTGCGQFNQKHGQYCSNCGNKIKEVK